MRLFEAARSGKALMEEGWPELELQDDFHKGTNRKNNILGSSAKKVKVF